MDLMMPPFPDFNRAGGADAGSNTPSATMTAMSGEASGSPWHYDPAAIPGSRVPPPPVFGEAFSPAGLSLPVSLPDFPDIFGSEAATASGTSRLASEWDDLDDDNDGFVASRLLSLVEEDKLMRSMRENTAGNRGYNAGPVRLSPVEEHLVDDFNRIIDALDGDLGS